VIEGQPIDWDALAAIRAELGADFARIFGYFQEDGAKSVASIEDATRDRDAVALVRPAHTLKSEAFQFGATDLGLMAERIEQCARRAVEDRDFPLELTGHAVLLRPLFDAAMAALSPSAIPATPVRRAVVFGRKGATEPVASSGGDATSMRERT